MGKHDLDDRIGDFFSAFQGKDWSCSKLIILK